MKIERVSFAREPEKLVGQEADCLWVVFRARGKKLFPLTSPALQWIDWKLQGELSRFVRRAGGLPTFLPTFRRLGSPYVALEPSESIDWKLFVRNCDGMKMKHVVLYCEDPEQADELEKQVKKNAEGDFPQRVTVACDEPAGKR